MCYFISHALEFVFVLCSVAITGGVQGNVDHIYSVAMYVRIPSYSH